MKKINLIIILNLLWLLTACGNTAKTPSPSETPSPSATPDPCNAAALPSTIKPLNNLTRQFDDYASLASNTPQSQLVQVIPPMQAIRRAAEDLPVPSCLKNLKQQQLSYMNITIQTLLAFESNAKPASLNTGIAQARQAHNQYTLELARLLGITVAAPTGTTPAPGNPPMTNTPAAAILMVSNASTNPINLHLTASLTSQIVGTLDPGQSARAIGRSFNGAWYVIEAPNVPGHQVWIYALLVQVTGGDAAALPVIATPTP